MAHEVNLDSDNNEQDTYRDSARLIPNASVDDSMDVGIMNSKRKTEMLNIRMESDGGEQDTSRVAPGRTLAANEGAASFGVPVGGSLGSEKQQDETLLAKWAHKERT